MSNKSTKQPEAKPVKQGPKFHLKESFLKLYNFVMFLGPSIAAYVLWFNGNSQGLKVIAGVLIVDAAVHVWKLVAVIK